MTPQVWIVLILFIIQIIYSIVSSAFSKEFREISFKNKESMGIYYFSTIIVLGILLIYGAHCSVKGSGSSVCELYSWVLAAVVGFVVFFTIVRSSILMVKAKDHTSEEY